MTTVAGCFLIVLTLAVLTACHKEPSLADARAHADDLAEALADSALARDFYFAVLAKVRDKDRAWDLYHAAQVRADSVYFIAYEILAKAGVDSALSGDLTNAADSLARAEVDSALAYVRAANRGIDDDLAYAAAQVRAEARAANRAEALAKTALAKIRSTARADAVFAIRACALVTVRAEVRDRPYTAANSLARATADSVTRAYAAAIAEEALAKADAKKALAKAVRAYAGLADSVVAEEALADTAALADSVVAKARVFARYAFKARYEDPVVHRMMVGLSLSAVHYWAAKARIARALAEGHSDAQIH